MCQVESLCLNTPCLSDARNPLKGRAAVSRHQSNKCDSWSRGSDGDNAKSNDSTVNKPVLTAVGFHMSSV